MKKVAVIGAGASGIIASVFAAVKNNKVTLFEKQSRIGRKILSTGNGRCNISNRNIDVSRYHGHNPGFVKEVFSGFGIKETLGFFESIGIPVVEEENGRLFPASLQASGVLDILDYELEKRGIDLNLNRKIEKIIHEGGKFRVITAGKEECLFDSVILSAGGLAGTGLGGSDSGYDIAGSLGHRIYDPFPALVPLNIPQKIMHTLEGVRWNCRVTAELKGRIISESEGELLFTKYGISGPAALNISRAVNENMPENNTGTVPVIIIDFFPGLSAKEVHDIFMRLWIDPDKTVLLSLSGIIKKRIPEVLLKIAGVDPYKTIKELSPGEMQSIIDILKSLNLSPGKVRLFKDAVVTAGGVDVEEIDPSCMGSRLIKNLFITGELLDIDGNSGGYNLQFAWSTGAIAGKAQ